MGGWQSTNTADARTSHLYGSKEHAYHNNYNNNQGAGGAKGDVVILPVDESSGAEQAFRWYVNHIHRPGNILRIVHCQELKINPQMLPELRTSTLQEKLEDAKNTGIEIIQKYEKRLRDHQISGSVHTEFGSSPGEVIIDAAHKHRGDMIVMGSRGFGVIRRTVLGSVSHYVIHHTQVPITIVPRDS